MILVPLAVVVSGPVSVLALPLTVSLPTFVVVVVGSSIVSILAVVVGPIVVPKLVSSLLVVPLVSVVGSGPPSLIVLPRPLLLPLAPS